MWAPQHLEADTESWDDAIEQAQLESPCLVAIVSKRSLDVPYVQRAIRHFVTRDKPVVLVQLGKLERPPMMIENMPLIRFNTRNPLETFRVVLTQLRKLNLSGE